MLYDYYINTYRSGFMHFKKELALMVRQKSIRRVVSSGGGAKGAVYPGSYKAMIDTGVIEGVEIFSGASAGAISAAFMAIQMPPDLLRAKLLNTNLEALKGAFVTKLFKRNPPGIAFCTTDAKPLEMFIRESIIESIRGSLKNLQHLEALSKKDNDLNRLVNKIKGKDPRITFADLALLNRFFPSHFKQLVLPAVKFPGGEVQIFNSTLTPNVEIALACRASASIPVLFEPVEIEIDGKKHKFVDGGVYDNLPTDYFDTDEKGKFIKNKIPEQTLVFAFGEGLDNKKNHVFQALYGQHLDHVVAEETLSNILLHAIDLFNHFIELEEETHSTKYEAELLIQAVKLVIGQCVESQGMTKAESKAIMDELKKSINSLLLKPQENQLFWAAYNGAKDQKERISLLTNFVKEQMKPVLYAAGIFERLKRDVLIEILGDFNAPYKNTQQKELGYQKLRSEYGLRTVELRVGDIKTSEFKKASKLARVMDSLGYLDTINHIGNHELHNPTKFAPELFYIDLVATFEAIHRATLLGASKNPNDNSLIKAINALKTQLTNNGKSDEVISRQVYQLIKDYVENHIDGIEAFALSRAVEFHNKMLTAEELFKETYEEGFKRSGSFSMSNITGKHLVRNSTLHESLKDKNMFELYKNQAPHQMKTRTDKVFDELTQLKDFNNANSVIIPESAPQLIKT